MKDYLIIGFAIFAAAIGVSLFMPHHAAAHGCDVLRKYSPLNDCEDGVGVTAGLEGLNKGSDDYRSSFENRITDYLNNGGDNQQAGAKYIIDHLGGTSDWKYTVSQLTIVEGDYKLSGSNCPNQYYENGGLHWEQDCGSFYSVKLETSGGKVVMAIKEDCGNPLGNLPAYHLNPPKPTGTLTDSCTNSTGDFTFKGTFTQKGQGATNAYIATSGNGIKLSQTAGTSPATWTVDGSGSTFNYSSGIWDHGTTVYLWVQDVSNGGWVRVASANRDNCAQYGGITVTCNSGVATVKYTFHDQDGSGGKTDAYTKVTTATGYASTHSGSSLNSLGFTHHSSATSANQTVNPPNSTTGDYYAWLFIYDTGPKGDHNYHATSDSPKHINCNAKPDGSITVTCTDDVLAYSGWFYDPDGEVKNAKVVYDDTGTTIKTYSSTDSNDSASHKYTFSKTVGSHAPGNVKLDLLVPNLNGGGANPMKWSDSYTCPSTVNNTCSGVSANAGIDPEPGQDIKVKVTIKYPSAADATTAQDDNYKLATTATNPDYSKTVTGASNLKHPSGYNQELTYTYDLASGIPATGNYTVTFTTNDSVSKTGIAAVNLTCPVDVSNKPYLQVFGGDVMGGVSTPSSEACLAPVTTGGISSWNSDNTSGYPGAGSQFGAQAMALITGFASAQGAGYSDGLAGSGLTFANKVGATTYPTGDTFGGKFAYSRGCNTDYIHTGSTYNGGLGPTNTIAAKSVSNSTQETLFYKGDVYITGNILYNNNNSWTDLSQIPSETIVAVGGNIYIKNSVTELDGTYVAEPTTAGAGGEIYTCATSAAAINTAGSNFFSNCDSQLVVNGSLVAGTIHFYRTCGSLAQATSSDATLSNGGTDGVKCSANNHAAEVVNYGAVNWYGQSAASSSGSWDAITSLPPVL